MRASKAFTGMALALLHASICAVALAQEPMQAGPGIGPALPESIAPGDPRRAAIFSAVHHAVDVKLKYPSTFIVRVLQVQGGFAFAELRPVAANGKTMDLGSMNAGWNGDDATLSVLLDRDRNGPWRVLELQVGTRVHPWASRFRAPDSLFPPDD